MCLNSKAQIFFLEAYIFSFFWAVCFEHQLNFSGFDDLANLKLVSHRVRSSLESGSSSSDTSAEPITKKVCVFSVIMVMLSAAVYFNGLKDSRINVLLAVSNKLDFRHLQFKE